jgi:hypothetical protein
MDEVKELAEDVFRTVDILRRGNSINRGRDFIVYAGNKEYMMILRYADHAASRFDQTFCGFRLIQVRLNSYWHVAIK